MSATFISRAGLPLTTVLLTLLDVAYACVWAYATQCLQIMLHVLIMVQVKIILF